MTHITCRQSYYGYLVHEMGKYDDDGLGIPLATIQPRPESFFASDVLAVIWDDGKLDRVVKITPDAEAKLAAWKARYEIPVAPEEITACG